jgi:hypothetical protein
MELGRIEEKVVVIYFKILNSKSLGGTEENTEKHGSKFSSFYGLVLLVCPVHKYLQEL